MSLKTDIETYIANAFSSGLYGIPPKKIQTCFSNLFMESVLSVFLQDFERYYPGRQPEADAIFSNLPLTGILMHRISRALFLKGSEEQACHFSNLVRLVSQMEIFYTADIGPGLKINHGFGLVIGAHCKIGSNALLYQNIVIGDKNPLSSNREKRPEIKDNLVMFSNAKILGPVKIGRNVIIEQNAVCTEDINSRHICMKDGRIKPLRNKQT